MLGNNFCLECSLNSNKENQQLNFSNYKFKIKISSQISLFIQVEIKISSQTH
jgi:hypothetical protein